MDRMHFSNIDLKVETTLVEIGFGCNFLVKDYYLAIIDDDIDKVKSIFAAIAEEHRHFLLDSVFKFNGNEMDHNRKDEKMKKPPRVAINKGKNITGYILKELKVSHPLMLAGAYGSDEVFAFLLEQGADILKADESKEGIVSLLVTACHTCPNEENKFLRIYHHILKTVTKPEDRKKLLLTERKEGLFPLEIAIKLRCYGLFKAILYTEGVFLKIKSHQGKVLEQEFDLTAYESVGGRCNKSPLNFFDYIRYSEIESFDKAGILQLPVIDEWIKRRVRKYAAWMVIWFLWRLFYPVVFLLYDYEYDKLFYEDTCKSTNATTMYLYRLILDRQQENPEFARQFLFGLANIAMAIPTLFFDITELILNLTTKTNYVTQYKGVPDHTHFVVDSRVFRVLQFCLACLGLVLAFIQFALTTVSDTYFILVFCMTTQRVLILFSLLYFAQIFRHVGFFIIGFQQMIIALVQFLVLFFGILVVFWTLFNSIGMYLCNTDGPFTNCNNNWENFYSSFLVMLNMVQISEQACHPVGLTMMEIFHMAYVFIITLLITNYLIAIMSSVYSDLGQYKQQVRILYKLALANLIEARLHWLATRMKLKCLLRQGNDLVITTQEVDGAIGLKSGTGQIEVKLVAPDQGDKLQQTSAV